MRGPLSGCLALGTGSIGFGAGFGFGLQGKEDWGCLLPFILLFFQRVAVILCWRIGVHSGSRALRLVQVACSGGAGLIAGYYAAQFLKAGSYGGDLL